MLYENRHKGKLKGTFNETGSYPARLVLVVLAGRRRLCVGSALQRRDPERRRQVRRFVPALCQVIGVSIDVGSDGAVRVHPAANDSAVSASPPQVVDPDSSALKAVGEFETGSYPLGWYCSSSQFDKLYAAEQRKRGLHWVVYPDPC